MQAFLKSSFVFSAFITVLCPPKLASAQFNLEPKERIVLLGDGLIEQEQYFGWLEVMIGTGFPESGATFRNLGWSGDTPGGASRFGLSFLQAGREPADEGWKQLQKQLEHTQPTLVILGYGMSNRLEKGVDGLNEFEKEYERLLKLIQQNSPDVRFVFLSPIRHLHANEDTELAEKAYLERMQEIAKRHDSPFVDLTKVANDPKHRKDPIHLNDLGYKRISQKIQESLGVPDSGWAKSPHTEILRRVILRKNEWWFHRSRPANMAYVFGFRKHEQGQNASEIPEFDKLIKEDEKRISVLVRLDGSLAKPPALELKSKFAKFQQQPIPEFTVHEDFEVTLWAQNPDLNKPIHMNFDASGRLWVASSEAYPMIEVGQSAPDRIIVLEDTNGDGKADASNVFEEGLLIPTGVAPGDGGVYVAQSTDLLHLMDTDGDGKADRKRRVLSGFGTEDTHHNLHTLRWGPDGRLYMNQSVYTRTDTETPHGVTRLKAGGGFRFDTKTMKMEIFFRGLWNSWGHQFDAYGQSFLTDGAGFAGVAYAFPGATFNPTPGARRQLDLISPGRWPKFASLEIIHGAAYPKDWQGSIITCDFRANRVTRFSVSEQQAGFVTQQEKDVLRSSSATFRPIDVKQGPDGALYIADWSNPIINHGEVDFRDERRDRWHGRIWRVAWKERPKPAYPKNLTKLDHDSLLALLGCDDRSIQDRARRQLIEIGVTSKIIDSWLKQQTSEALRLQALWLNQAINSPNLELLRELLHAKDHRVRAAAARVIPDWIAEPNSEETQLFEQLVSDVHPRVRLESVRALGKIGSPSSIYIALQVLNHPMDRFLDHALGLTVAEHQLQLMANLNEQQKTLPPNQLQFVLQVVEPSLASYFLSERLKQDPIPRDGSGPWIELIAQAGGTEELNRLLELATKDRLDPTATKRAVAALLDAQKIRRTRPSKNLNTIGGLLGNNDADIQQGVLELIGLWRVRKLSPRLQSLANQRKANAATRVQAVNALRLLGEKRDTFQALFEDNENPLQVRVSALRAIITKDAELGSTALLSLLGQAGDEQTCLNIWQQALGSTKDFGKVVAKKDLSQLPSFAIQAGIRATQGMGDHEKDLLAALQDFGMQSVVNMSPEQMNEIAKLALQGDPVRGELVYRRKDLACSTCHAIGGAGGLVGPDMTSLGASAPIDYLVESLFDPNAKIKEGYHSVTILTEDDTFVSGIPLPKSTSDIVFLRDAKGKEIAIPTVDIVVQKPNKSLMPTGVVDRLSREEQVDLVAFLSRLGKPGRYDASQGGVARSYQIFAGTHRREQQGVNKILNGAAPGWIPMQSFVSGELNASELLTATKQPINISLVHIYLKTKFTLSGDRTVELSGPSGAALWVDQVQLNSSQPSDIKGLDSFSADLKKGDHEIIVRLDARELPKPIKLMSTDVVFLH